MNKYVKYTDPLDGEYSIFKVHDKKGSWLYDKFNHPYPASCCSVLPAWHNGDKLRHKESLKSVIFTGYNNSTCEYFYQLDNMSPLKSKNYIKAPEDN